MERFEGYYEMGELFAKYVKGELDSTEEKKLNDWIDASSQNRLFFEKMTEADYLSRQLRAYINTDRDKSWDIIRHRIEPVSNKPVINLRRYYKYAAGIALVLLPLAFLTYNYLKKPSDGNQPLSSYAETVIPPGKERATLELPDGRIVDLEKNIDGGIALEENVFLKKDKEGRLVYEVRAGAEADGKDLSAYHVIRTPRSGTYQVVLPDGTHIWLNALSSLRFPTHFSGNTRAVQLTGEAYFDVAKNKEKPFVVDVNDTKVQVLGTQFNITADKGRVYTTLLEGSVKVFNGGNMKKLVPGEQAVAQGRNLAVKAVDTEPIVAWKEGYFIFRNTPIQELMESISKWYDVDVDYVGDMEHIQFGGKFSRSTTLQELLKSLELTGTVRFKVEGRRVTAMQ